MKDATPRSLEDLQRRATSYEVAAVHDPSGDSVVIGFTSRTSRLGLINLIQSRGEDLLELMDVPEDSEAVFEKDGAGRWEIRFTGTGWKVRLTGYTERDVAMMNADPLR